MFEIVRMENTLAKKGTVLLVLLAIFGENKLSNINFGNYENIKLV